MTIFTKSVQAEVNKSDGVRICVMRRVKPEFLFDIWIPTLAPSTELLKSYHDKKVNWEEYERRYKIEVLDKQKKYLQILIDIVLKNDITLLCWEKTPEECHRRLLAERLERMNPNLSIKLQ